MNLLMIFILAISFSFLIPEKALSQSPEIMEFLNQIDSIGEATSTCYRESSEDDGNGNINSEKITPNQLNEEGFIGLLKSDPVSTYRDLLIQKKKNINFSFKALIPTLNSIMELIDRFLTMDSEELMAVMKAQDWELFSIKHSNTKKEDTETAEDLLKKVERVNTYLNEAKSKLATILEQGAPYGKSLIFINKFLMELDEIYYPYQPTHKTDYYANLVMAPFLAIPDVVVLPLNKEIDLDYFIQTRPVPVFILGVTLGPVTMADGGPISPFGFFWHDSIHTKEMYSHNILDGQSIGHDEDNIKLFSYWVETAKAFHHFVLGIKKLDPPLALAMELLLFTHLHEDGNTWDLSQMRVFLGHPVKAVEELMTRIHDKEFSPSYNQIEVKDKLKPAAKALLEFSLKLPIQSL